MMYMTRLWSVSWNRDSSSRFCIQNTSYLQEGVWWWANSFHSLQASSDHKGRTRMVEVCLWRVLWLHHLSWEPDFEVLHYEPRRVPDLQKCSQELRQLPYQRAMYTCKGLRKNCAASCLERLWRAGGRCKIYAKIQGTVQAAKRDNWMSLCRCQRKTRHALYAI